MGKTPSPSGANRWVPCPGSFQAQAGLPRSPSNPQQGEGLAIAWACDRVLTSWHSIAPGGPVLLSSFLGTTSPGNEGNSVITDEMITGGNKYLEHIWGKVYSHVEGMQSEKQLSAWSFIAGLDGRADCVFRTADATHFDVWDFKWGYGPVGAFENYQLLSYALGMVTEHTRTLSLNIVQPNGPTAATPVKPWDLSIDSLRGYAEVMRVSFEQATGPNPPRRAGKHCRYCRAADRCETNQAAAFGGYESAFGVTNVEITDDQLAYEIVQMDTALALVRARLDALEGQAVGRITAGRTLKGLQYRQTLGNRQWTRDDKFMRGFGALHGVEIEETKTKLLSPNQLANRGVSWEAIDLYTKRPNNAPKLARIDPALARRVFSQ